MRRFAAVLALTLVTACGGDGSAGPPPTTDRPGGAAGTTSAPPASAADGPAAADLCAGAAPVGGEAKVADPDLTEVSGLALSRRHPGVVWVHNDSGSGPVVHALGDDGRGLGSFRLQGADATDWEDMALGPGPPGGADRLYLGDIGDNRSVREHVEVYRVAEPDVDAGAGEPAGDDSALADVERLSLRYADGAHDAETLLADPLTGDLFVVTKEWGGAVAGVYRIPAGSGPQAAVVMDRRGEVPALAGQLATGGDVSAGGSLVAIRTYGAILVWDRARGQSVPDALAGEPCRAPSPVELQGEALGFTPEADGYITIAEGRQPDVNHYTLD